MSDGPAVARLTAALADGDAIEWDAAEAGARSDRERSIVRQLKGVAWLERQSRAGMPRPARAGTAPLIRPWAVLLTIVAAAQVGVAILAFPILAAGATSRHWIQLGILSAFTASAVLLAAGGRRDVRARRLALFSLLIAAAISRPLLAAVTPAVAWLTWLWTGVHPASFLGVAAWQFAREFPFVVRFTRFDRIAERLSAAALLAGLVLFAVSAVPEAVAAASADGALGWLWTLRRDHESARFWDVTYLFMLSAMAAVAVRARQAPYEERRRVLWFAIVLLLGFGPLLLVGLMQGLVPGLAGWRTRWPLTGRVVDAVVLGGLLATPLATAYVVLVHRLLAVRIVVRRALTYALARYTLAAITIALLAFVAAEAYGAREQRLQDLWLNPRTRTAIQALALLAVLMMARGRLLRVLDRLFLGRDVDHAGAIARAAASIGRGRTPLEVAAETARAARDALQVSHAAVFAREDDGRWQTLHGSAAAAPTGEGDPVERGEAAAAPPPPGDGALVAMAAADAAPILVGANGRLFDLLPEADRIWIARGGFETLVRLPGAGGDLVGLLAAGPRLNGFPASAADLAFLSAAAATAGVALETRRAADVRRESPDEGELAFECERCGAMADAPGDCGCGEERRLALLPLVLHDKFRLVRRIGRGGMGVVYLATDTRLDRRVALKTLPERSGTSVASMLDEARVMAAVEHHSLALIFGLEVWRRTPVLVVEYLAGGTLAARLGAGRLDVADALALGAALADGLAALHQQGILHRDIKPSNIGFGRTGTPKLLDFGLARLLSGKDRDAAGEGPGLRAGDSAAYATGLAGTPLYLSPEALGGRQPDEHGDLWALSLVLFEGLAGAHPFQGATVADVVRRIRDAGELDLRRYRADAPDALVHFCRRSLHPDLSRRPASASSLAGELRAINASLR